MAEQFNKRDLQIILEVNRKAIEIETTVADQNEEIIDLLGANKDKQERLEEKLDKVIENNGKIIDKGEAISKDLFKIQVLFITGILALIGQIIEIFLKK